MQTFTNQASLSYQGLNKFSNITSGEIIDALSITKTAIVNKYQRETVISYLIGITNNTTTNYTDISITDNLGELNISNDPTTPEYVYPLSYLDTPISYFVDSVPTPIGSIAATIVGTDLVISNIPVPANKSVQIGYSVKTNEFAPFDLASEIKNVINVDSSLIAIPLTADETIMPDTALDIEIKKTLSPTSISASRNITYTFDILNYGNTASVNADELILSDTFDPVITITSVVFKNGTNAPVTFVENTNYTYNAAGEFKTLLNNINVPAATYTRDPITNQTIITPGKSTLTINGTI